MFHLNQNQFSILFLAHKCAEINGILQILSSFTHPHAKMYMTIFLLKDFYKNNPSSPYIMQVDKCLKIDASKTT